jgi:hypothetical protein
MNDLLSKGDEPSIMTKEQYLTVPPEILCPPETHMILLKSKRPTNR